MQMKPYPKYKDSGIEWIGEIPEGWESRRLRFNCKVNPTEQIGVSNKKTKVTFLPMDRVSVDGEYDRESEAEYCEVSTGYTYFTNRDVLIAKITPCFENGKGCYVDNLTNNIGFGTTEFHVLRSHNNMNPEFILYFSRSHLFRIIGEAFMQGAAGQKRISTDFTKDFRMPTPPKPEQREIATFLDKKTSEINDLIAKNKELIELEKEKRVALINHAVTKGLDTNVKLKDSGVEWIGEIPEDWGIRKFSHISKRISVGFVGSIEKHYTDETGIPLLKTGNIGNGEVLLNKLSYVTKEFHYANVKSQLIPGDIIIARHGESGKSAVIAKMLKHANCLNIVLLKVGSKMYGKYYSYLMNAHIFLEHLQAIQGGSVQGVINTEDISQMKVIFLPKPEQEAIVEYLDKHTANIDKTINKNIEILEEYKQSLIHHVVTGKVDVREIAA